jgi:hypothetical protein
MDDVDAMRRVAREVLQFGDALLSRDPSALR